MVLQSVKEPKLFIQLNFVDLFNVSFILLIDKLKLHIADIYHIKIEKLFEGIETYKLLIFHLNKLGVICMKFHFRRVLQMTRQYLGISRVYLIQTLMKKIMSMKDIGKG